MSTLLKGYRPGDPADKPHFTFESKVGPFEIQDGHIISFTYDAQMVIWAKWDREAGRWYVDLAELGIFDSSIDEQHIYLSHIAFEEKTSFTQPIVSELGPELRERLDSIDLKISTVLNTMDAAKEREEKALGRMSEFLSGDIDAETLLQDALNEYTDAGLADLTEATL